MNKEERNAIANMTSIELVQAFNRDVQTQLSVFVTLGDVLDRMAELGWLFCIRRFLKDTRQKNSKPKPMFHVVFDWRAHSFSATSENLLRAVLEAALQAVRSGKSSEAKP